MEKIDSGDSLHDVKKRIADIINKNDLAISELHAENEHDALDNNLGSKLKKQPDSFGYRFKMDVSKTMISKTNANGIIVSANDFFFKISGYKEFELYGQLYNIIYHSDMPSVILENVWRKLSKGETFLALVKNLAKDGRYFWSLNHYKTITDRNGAILSYSIEGKAMPDSLVFQIEKIYHTLISIEERKGVESSFNYLVGLLEDENCPHDTSIIEILSQNIELGILFDNKSKNKLARKRKELLTSFFNKKLDKP